MKKIILSALAICAFTFSNAQETATETSTESVGFAQGDMFISGSFGIMSTSTGDAKENSFTIAPRAAYFLSDNIAVGMKLGYMSEKGDDAAGVENMDMSTLTVGAMARYYMTPASKFSLFGEFGVDYMSMDNKLAEYKLNGFGLAVSPGVSYFVSSNFAIEATWGALGYSSVKGDWTDAESTDGFELGLNMESLNLGLLYKF